MALRMSLTGGDISLAELYSRVQSGTHKFTMRSRAIMGVGLALDFNEMEAVLHSGGMKV